MNFTLPGGHRRGRSAGSSSRAWSTRARSRCTGASTAGPRWPRPRSSTRTTRRRRSTSSSRSRREPTAELGAARAGAGRARRVSVLIWTTTPWTIPSNLAIAFHPDFDYGAYDGGRPRGDRRRGAGRARGAAGRAGRSARRSRAIEGRELERLRFRIRSTRATRSACSADYVTLEQGTGAVHTAPGHGADDFATGVTVRPRDLRAGRARRATSSTTWSCSPASGCSTRTREVEEALQRARPALAPRSRSSTPIRTAGAATTR